MSKQEKNLNVTPPVAVSLCDGGLRLCAAVCRATRGRSLWQSRVSAQLLGQRDIIFTLARQQTLHLSLSSHFKLSISLTSLGCHANTHRLVDSKGSSWVVCIRLHSLFPLLCVCFLFVTVVMRMTSGHGGEEWTWKQWGWGGGRYRSASVSLSETLAWPCDWQWEAHRT